MHSQSQETCKQFCCAVFCNIKCLWIGGINLPISFRGISPALGQSHDCPSPSEVTMKDMGKISQFSTTTRQDKVWILCIYDSYVLYMSILTRLPLDKMATILADIGSALVQVIAWRMFAAKPLPEPVLDYCQMDSWEQISVKFELEFSFQKIDLTRTTRTPAFWGYPRRLMITHTIEPYWIPSQSKTKSKLHI